MALFEFTALRGNEQFSGAREAQSKQEIVDALRKEGAVALSVLPAKHHRSTDLLHKDLPFLSSVKTTDKINFARNLSAMIAAGLSLSRALSVMERQAKGKFKRTLQAIEEAIKQGKSLSEALTMHPSIFPPLFIAMTHAGEESGTLPQALQLTGVQMERSYVLTKKVKGAMIYPAVVVTVMLAIGVLMLIFVVPILATTFESLNTKLPLPTRFIIGLSNAFNSNAILFGLGAVVSTVAFIASMRTQVGKRVRDHLVLRLPVVGNIVKKVNAARTARTLSSLLSSGVESLNALSITGNVVQNIRFKHVVAQAREYVEKGKPFSGAFIESKNLYPDMFSEMVAVGEETGDLSGMLGRVAEFYEEEVEQQTKDLSTLIEPVLMVVIGGGVAFFAIAMIAPIYSISSAI